MTLWIRCALYLFILLGTTGVRAEVPTTVALPASDTLVAAPDEAEPAPAGSIAVPELKSPVTDFTGTLGSDWVAAMKQRLLALQQRKGSQIAILMLASTGEDSIEQFATRVFEQWRLGRRGVDDGVLVLVAKDDRTMRIEVGYGLEGAIPDVVAGRIIREEMVPAFRSGDFAGGIENAVNVLERLIDGETLPDERGSGGLTWEGWLLLIGLLGGGVAGVVLRRRWLAVKIVLPALAVATVLMAVSGGLRSLPMLLMAIPFSMLFGAGIGALAAGSRLSAGIVGGIIGYLVALMVCASYYDGGEVALYGLALPIGSCIGLALLCLPFVLAYQTWKRSRVAFGIRLTLALVIAGAVIHLSGVLQQPWAFPDSLVLVPMLFFPLLFAFAPGGSGSGGSGGSSSGGGSSSSSGSSYSGGGGSSGGGGASGSW
ncbi:TPM domain-containing protein [Pseudomonas nicosulfuronedens]